MITIVWIALALLLRLQFGCFQMEEVEEKQMEGTHVVIETLGIGQQGKQTFALYNVRVKRVDANGKTVSGWNVLRRYSDFHTLHSLIESRVRFVLNVCWKF